MSFKLKRSYTDVHGNARVLIWKENVDGLVGYRYEWHKQDDLDVAEKRIVYSGASRWYTEDGSIIQIPEEAWQYTNINYKDEYIYE